MRIVFTIIFLIGCAMTASAQKQQALTALQRMTDAYRSTAGLSFDVLFRYASEEAPANWLDSLGGRFVINGRQYWSDIDNTQTICTGACLITLFKEDQLMYLTKPLDNTGMAAAVTGQLPNLENDSTIRWTLTDMSKQKKITLDFTSPSTYKRIEYFINKQSGLLEKMISVVKSDQLYTGAGESYAVVEAIYSNQKPGAVDAGLFNPERYFKKEGNDYTTVAPYDSYKIFAGSSNL